jgi:hypothetical protein
MIVTPRSTPTAIAILVVALLSSAPASAQVPEASRFIPPVAEIAAMLRSIEPREQAWGAWLAAQAKATSLVPDLQRVADRHRDATAWTERVVSGAALDALIQMQVRVPAAWVRPFFATRPAETLILLSRADDAEDVLFDLVSSQQGIPWFAAAGLLLKKAPSRLAPPLLADLEIELLVSVVADPSQMALVGVGGASAGAGHGGGALLPGFPPIASYYLSGGNPGGTLLTDGPRSVFFFRDVSQPGSVLGATEHTWGGPSMSDRLAYVAALLGQPGRPLAVSATESRSVVWRSQQQIELDIASFRGDVSRRFGLLVAQLVDARLLSSEEASRVPAPRITVTVRDLRPPWE